MLGSRQLQILECLELGSISIPALMLRMGAHDQDRRGQIYAALAQLERRGLVRVVGGGQRGQHEMAAEIVERVGSESEARPPPLA